MTNLTAIWRKKIRLRAARTLVLRSKPCGNWMA